MFGDKKDAARKQPTSEEISDAIIYFSGPVVTCRCFKQSAPNRFRSIVKAEYESAVTALVEKGVGSVATIHIARQRKSHQVFIKKAPTELPPEHGYDTDTYKDKYNLPTNKNITQAMREELVN